MARSLDTHRLALEAWAHEHSLTSEELNPPYTPERLAELCADWFSRDLTGTLPGGERGTVRITFEHRNPEFPGTWPSEGALRMTWVEVRGLIPHSIGFVPTLLCSDPAWAQWARGAFTGIDRLASRQRTVQFESVALDRKFALQVNPAQDQNWLYQLFPPTFVDWLAEHAPLESAFSLDHGTLTVHDYEACRALTPTEDGFDIAALNRYCELYSKIAARIRGELAEELEAAGTAEPRVVTSVAAARAAEAEIGAGGKAKIARRAGTMSAFTTPFIVIFVFPIVFGMTFFLLAVLRTSASLDAALGTLVLPAAVVGGAVSLYVAASAGRNFAGATPTGARVAESYHGRPSEAAAFSRFAKPHGMKKEDPAAFHMRYAGLDLPGTATHVVTGPLPGLGREGSVAACANRLSRDDHDIWNVLVTRDRGKGLPSGLPDGYAAVREGEVIAICKRDPQLKKVAEPEELARVAAEALGGRSRGCGASRIRSR